MSERRAAAPEALAPQEPRTLGDGAQRQGGHMTRRIGDVVLDVKNIGLSFGGVKALADISFDVREHEVRAIIGPNGAGKSSMLNCINGVYQPQQGTITFMPLNKARFWNVRAMPISATWRGFMWLNVRPRKVMVPCCGW